MSRRQPPIRNAHVKQFQSVSDKKNCLVTKWIEVKLQILVGSEDEAQAVCERLARHMDQPLPRFMSLSEQP